ncbi:MAG TPA: polynucleotide adenylyltransferase PcnB [Gammaproteobacteria bacterium]|nr:polynucleotide adenylyltransferase PcnB [Gammaproteobacteria bacterium]HAS48237.1 polynucleotide adenylyltransferase PcnB [Gammaproteobacteria bacterium]
MNQPTTSSSTSALAGIEKATLLERDHHPISRKQISPNAVRVLYKLAEAGHHGFLVGGGVRDLLLGKSPKDFDIATDASPEQLKSLFRNARIIGRRFKIIHLRFGREIIEVTTFRAPHDTENKIADNVPRRRIQNQDSAHSTAGMILRDNVYGNIDEDALRRDFTINALYYTIDKFRILDFSTGLEDLESKQIRMIGDPAERYKEDPVRMLRAIRFAAKLGFSIEEKTEKPIDELAHLLESISTARLFDETIKLMAGGHAVKTFELLRRYRPGMYLFAPTFRALEKISGPPSKLVDLALENTDSRLAAGKSVTPAFLFAALLWPVLQLRLQSLQSNEANQHQLFQQAAQEVLMEQIQYTAVPKRFTIATKEIWDLQSRLMRDNRRSIDGAFNHPRFRAAYDFLLLREDAGEDLGGRGAWWTEYQIGATKQDIKHVNSDGEVPKKRRRRRKPKPKPAA